MQSIDEALRKSEWSTYEQTCDPPLDSYDWEISFYCPVTVETLDAFNITVLENGFLDIQSDTFISPHTNITVFGSFSARNITLDQFVYHGDENITHLNVFGESVVVSNITLQDSFCSNLRVFGNVTLLDVNGSFARANDGIINRFVTTHFLYQNQFHESLTGVSTNVSGVFSTNTSYALLVERNDTVSNTSFFYETVFTKPLYYNTTISVIPNASVVVVLF